MTAEVNEILLTNMPPLISENDLYVSQLVLSTLTSMILSHKAFSDKIPQFILPETLVLVRSPLMQGSTLEAMVNFFRAIVQSSFPGLDSNELIARLTEPILASGNSLHKQSFFSISKSIAAIALLNSDSAISTMSSLANQLCDLNNQSNINFEFIQLYSLLTIAEIGKHVDSAQLQDFLQDCILNAFNASNEDVKAAASICLGSIAVGNMNLYLPTIIYGVQERQKRQYLYLNALKETIICSTVGDQSMQQNLELHFDSIWNLLLKQCDCNEEGTRQLVAECLGKLTLLKPAQLLPQLFNNLQSESPHIRETIISAIRFTILDKPHPIDDILKSNIDQFIKTLQDSDISVRRVAFLALNSALHMKPSLVRDSFNLILPLLYTEIKPKVLVNFFCAVFHVLPSQPELVHDVEMGPFKHRVDDGLDFRKTAFECMYTLLESSLDRIDVFEYLCNVEIGLKDTHDIQMLVFIILIRLADVYPSAIVERKFHCLPFE